MSLRNTFKFNTIASSSFGVIFGLLPEWWCVTAGFAPNPAAVAICRMWGFGMQPWLAWTQWTVSEGPETELSKHALIHTFWWSACGTTMFVVAPDRSNPFLLANVVFMLGHAAAYFVNMKKTEKKD